MWLWWCGHVSGVSSNTHRHGSGKSGRKRTCRQHSKVCSCVGRVITRNFLACTLKHVIVIICHCVNVRCEVLQCNNCGRCRRWWWVPLCYVRHVRSVGGWWMHWLWLDICLPQHCKCSHHMWWQRRRGGRGMGWCA